MGLLAATKTYLSQWAPLLTLLGPGADARICADAVPQGAKGDHVVYQRIDTPQARLLNGRFQRKVRALLQVDVWASTPDRREALAKTVRRAFELWRGVWGDTSIDEVNKTADFDGSSDPMDGGGTRDFRTTLRYAVWNTELALTEI